MKMLPEKRALDKVYKRRDRYEIPDWQREDVWTPKKKRQLIDSILRGWKLPKFYFLRIHGEGEEFEVVDGQQRLVAIFEFFDNELELSQESEERFGGRRYRDLAENVSDDFDDFEIEYDVIEDADEKDLKEFFQRLQDGLPLTSSEKLNAVHSRLRDYCRTLAKHRFLTEKTSVSDHRYGLFDIVSKVAAIEAEGIDVGLRYDDLKQVFESQASFSGKSNVAQRLRDTFDYLDRAFPTKEPRLRNRTIVQSLATFTAKVIAGGNSTGYESKLRSFFMHFLGQLSRQVELGQEATDLDYVRFQKTVNANVRSGPKTRQEILLRKLLTYDPASTELFDPTTMSESGIEKRVMEMTDSITTLIGDINVNHASTHGIDLFKSTNKTTQALSRIGKTLRDYAD